MTDQPNILQELFDIFVANPEDTGSAVKKITELGGIHLDVSVSFGGMLMMIMAAYGYNSPQDVWDDLSIYQDMNNS